MLLRGSILCQLAGLLIFLSASVLGANKKNGFVPSYDEFYNTRAAYAIKDIGLEPGDLVSIASSRIVEYAERDQDSAEAKEKPRQRTYEIPRDTLAKFSLEGAYEDEIDALDREYSSPTVYKLDSVKVSDTQKEESPADVQYTSSSKSDKPKSKPYKSSYYVSKSKHSKPKKAYQEESKEEEQQPSYVPDYSVKQAKAPKIDEAPYKQYVSYNAKPKSTENSYQTYKPFNPQPSAASAGIHGQASEQIASGDCQEVKKKSGGKGPEMKCVVCTDPKTKSKSEQCSFNSSPEPEAYFVSKSSKYSQPQKETNQRFKRYTGRHNDDSKEEIDPYERFKAESQKYSVVDEDDFFKDFKFPSGYSGSSDTLEKSESENQAEKMMKDGGTCKEEKKNGMNCKVCKNEKTGGNYETCSYSSAPNEKKYAFVSEKKSNGNGEPTEKLIESKGSNLVEKKFEPKVSESQQDAIKKSRGNTKAKLVDDTPYEVPKHFAEETKEQQQNDRSKYYHSRDDDAKSSEAQSADDYYRKLFDSKPARAEEKRTSNAGDNTQQDVEKVLEEFAKKDRSTCKKAVKNGMTCYLCVRKDGTQHEECMYVTGRQPQKSHVAYHEVEQLKSNRNNNNNKRDKEGPASAASTVREVTIQKRKRPLKKAYANNQAASSSKVTTTAKFTPAAGAPSVLSLVNGKFRQPRKLRRTQNYSGADALVQETQNIPTVVRVKAVGLSRPKAVEPAAASSENNNLYTDELGVRLPKYLLEKSDFEKSFNVRH